MLFISQNTDTSYSPILDSAGRYLLGVNNNKDIGVTPDDPQQLLAISCLTLLRPLLILPRARIHTPPRAKIQTGERAGNKRALMQSRLSTLKKVAPVPMHPLVGPCPTMRLALFPKRSRHYDYGSHLVVSFAMSRVEVVRRPRHCQARGIKRDTTHTFVLCNILCVCLTTIQPCATTKGQDNPPISALLSLLV